MEEEEMGIFIDNSLPRAYFHFSRILGLSKLLIFVEEKWKMPHYRSSMLSSGIFAKEQVAKQNV